MQGGPQCSALYCLLCLHRAQVCKRERRYGSESTTTIDLWTPGEFSRRQTAAPPAGMQGSSQGSGGGAGGGSSTTTAGTGAGSGAGGASGAAGYGGMQGGKSVDVEVDFLGAGPIQQAYKERIQKVLQVLQDLRGQPGLKDPTKFGASDPEQLHAGLRSALAAAGFNVRLTGAAETGSGGGSGQVGSRAAGSSK